MTMSYNLIIFYVILVLQLISFLSAQNEINREMHEVGGVEVESGPNKVQYKVAVPSSDKHRFGYEILDTSKSFHHTSTEKDGVRLGCYGYVLDGRKYSTQYVADTKGYRIVNTNEPIDVFPKSGEPRKASFVDQFDEDERKSQNIRFFFPDGCKREFVQTFSGASVDAENRVTKSPAIISTYPYVLATLIESTTDKPNLLIDTKSLSSASASGVDAELGLVDLSNQQSELSSADDASGYVKLTNKPPVISNAGSALGYFYPVPKEPFLQEDTQRYSEY